MNIKQLNEVLKAHGLEAKKTEDGDVKITEETLEALADCREPTEHYYVIQGRYEVDITYRVPGTSFDDALDKLRLKELFQQHGMDDSPLFGPCEYTMEGSGIEVVEADCTSDPDATGYAHTRRGWEWHVEDEDGEWLSEEEEAA